MPQYVVTVDTTDITASKRHAGQLHLIYEEVATPQEWPGLRLRGNREALQRFLALHCGSTRDGLEYFADHAKVDATIKQGELVENVDGPGAWQYGVITDATPNDQGQVLVHWDDGEERWFNPCHLAEALSEDIQDEDSQAWTVLAPLVRS